MINEGDEKKFKKLLLKTARQFTDKIQCIF